MGDTENTEAEKPAPQSAEQRKAHVEALKVEADILNGRDDAVGQRRLAEVNKQLDRFGEKPTHQVREVATADGGPTQAQLDALAAEFAAYKAAHPDEPPKDPETTEAPKGRGRS